MVFSEMCVIIGNWKAKEICMILKSGQGCGLEVLLILAHTGISSVKT